jgi:hypothetical protein
MMRYLRSVLFQVFIALDSARQSVGFVHGQLDFDHIYMEPTDQSWTKLSVVDEWPGSPAFPLSQQDLNRTALFENRLFTNQSNPIIFACPWMPPVNRNNTATAYWRFRRSDEFYYLPVRDSYQRYFLY